MPQNISFDTKNIKIAFVSDDGETISQHFGRAMYYEVLTIKDSKVTGKEKREKAGHHTFHQEEHGHGHHHHPESGEHQMHKHNTMVAPITDCDYLVARGMGNGAYAHLAEANIKPIITNQRTIDDAINQILKGNLTDHTEKLH